MGSDIVSFGSLAPAYPEILLAICSVALLLVGVLLKRDHAVGITAAAVVILVVVALVAATQTGDAILFNGLFVSDAFSRFMKLLVLGGSAFALILALSNLQGYGIAKFEYAALVLLATLGMMVMVSANDLMTLYVGLELQSLAIYVLAAIHRENLKASEAGLKYFVLGALSSGMLLYGASLIYGFTGHTQINEIAQAIATNGRSIGIVFGLVFLLAGIAFKLSLVPFHMWTPDVYEGAPTPVTALLASAPKMAAMALMVRIVTESFEPLMRDWQQVIIFVSLASMVLAAFAAIGQKNIKRLMAYSAISHMGFALVGLSSGTAVGVEGVAVYMAIYLLMTIGFFACLLSLKTGRGQVETIDELAGLARKRPFIAAVLAIIMFSLIGMPPLAGFFAKWQVFLAAIEAKLFVLAVIGMLASAVSAYYYLRVIKVMYFDEPVDEFAAVPRELTVVIAIAGFLVVTYFLTIGAPLTNAAHIAAGSLF